MRRFTLMFLGLIIVLWGLFLNNMSFEVITYNIQRNYSGNAVTAVHQLVRDYSDAIICLQEVTPSVGKEITNVFPKSVHQGENMMIMPQGVDIYNPQSLSFGSKTRSFLSAQISR